MQTHKTHIQNLIQILGLKKKFFVVGTNIEIKEYAFEEAIAYFHKMFSFLDAHRIIFYGVGHLVQHVELLRLLLIALSQYLYDKAIFDATKQLLKSLNDFLAEYSFDQSRHSINYISGGGNKSFLFEGNAYQFQTADGFHVFLQFLGYIMQALQAYVSMKQQCVQLLKLLPRKKTQHVIRDIRFEIDAFEALIQDMENVAHIVREICEKESGFYKRKAMLHEIYVTSGDKDNKILYGISDIAGLFGSQDE